MQAVVPKFSVYPQMNNQAGKITLEKKSLRPPINDSDFFSMDSS